jgi:tripartite-type tricarboxylate transporter receptor subunit TctC
MNFGLCRLLAVAAAAWALVLPSAVQAQKFPNKPVTIIVPYSAGGPSDIVTRVVASGMARYLGESVVVENKPGANGLIGMEYVARQPGDGYTLVMFSLGGSVLNSVTRSKLPYNLTRDFRAVGNMAVLPQLAVVSPNLPVNTLKEFVAYAKAHPGELSYGSSGIGGTPHLVGEWLKILAGIQMTHVPYKGTGPATVDLIAGRINFLWTEVPVLLQHVREGKIKALAVSTRERSPLLPNVPTIAEAGFPQLTGANWFGLQVPSSTPDNVVTILNDALVKALNDPQTHAALVAQGAIPDPAPAAQFDKLVRDELARWSEVVRMTNIHLD